MARGVKMKWSTKSRWGEASNRVFRLSDTFWGGEGEDNSQSGEKALPLKSWRKRKRLARWKESAIQAFFFTNGVLAIIVLIGIFLILLYTAIRGFKEIP